MMNPIVLNPVTKKYADYSTLEGFSFGFFCDKCEKEWRSVRYDFNPGGFALPMDPTVHEMLWNNQHKEAYERVSREASLAFNRCPACGRWVCNACFFLSETGASDICRDCLSGTGAKDPIRREST